MGKDKKPKRNYKDSVFRMLFNDKEGALELFNALEGTNYGPETEVEFTTLDDAIYSDIKNDISFIIDGRLLVFCEHQSTKSMNMPIRQLFYAARNFEREVKAKNLYGMGAVKIPTPEFYVVYTGKEKWEVEFLKLSDSFLGPPPKNSMELVVKVLSVRYNIDEEENSVVERSEKLKGYSQLLHYIDIYCTEEGDLEDAIDRAVERCIKENVLREFLEKNSAEVGSMLWASISTEEFIELRVEEGIAIGIEKRMEERMPELKAELEAKIKKKVEAELKAELEAELKKKAEAEARKMTAGKAEALAEEKVKAIAKKMKAGGIPIETIAEMTELDESVIKPL